MTRALTSRRAAVGHTGVEDFNPARPETLHITGGTSFDLPAQCGIGATLKANVSLRASIVCADVGLGLGAEAGLRAGISPHVDVSWRAATGLQLQAELGPPSTNS